MRVLDEAERLRIRAQLPVVFTPAAPVSRGELFAGRMAQIRTVLRAVASPGQHAIVFGERGVGKTSLASLIHYFWREEVKDADIIAPWITCEVTDTFGTVWTKVLEAITDYYKIPRLIHAHESDPISRVIEEINDGGATPNLVRRFFLLSGQFFVVTIDEFDRVEDAETKLRLADTIKTLSDHRIMGTILLVGVADTVEDLLEDHASIGRNLVQVLMPRMSHAELKDIVLRGLGQLGAEIDEQVLEEIASFSQGLPHYTHQLALNAAICAVNNMRTRIEASDLDAARSSAVSSAHHTVIASYSAAIGSSKPRALFKQVLLACALTAGDELGYFTARDVVEPLEHVTKKHYEIPSFVQHLHAFCQEDRACVLQETGSKYKRKYRFTDPVLKPYIVMRGIQDSLIGKEYALSRS